MLGTLSDYEKEGNKLKKDNQQPSSVFRELPEDNDYLVYEDGRVFSRKTNRFLAGKIDNMGYKTYSLAIGGKISANGKKLSKMVYAHRLVALVFLDNPNNYPYVHHKDENKLNNHYSNLEWVSPKLNSYYHNQNKKTKREYNPKYYIKDLEGEKWMIIPEYLNYSISSFGRVRNNRTNRLLKIDNNQNYSRISFNDKKHYYIHRLVYCVFNNDYDLEGYVIDHIDGDKRNNKLENLQKITQQENCLRQKRFNDYPSGE